MFDASGLPDLPQDNEEEKQQEKKRKSKSARKGRSAADKAQWEDTKTKEIEADWGERLTLPKYADVVAILHQPGNTHRLSFSIQAAVHGNCTFQQFVAETRQLGNVKKEEKASTKQRIPPKYSRISPQVKYDQSLLSTLIGAGPSAPPLECEPAPSITMEMWNQLKERVDKLDKINGVLFAAVMANANHTGSGVDHKLLRAQKLLKPNRELMRALMQEEKTNISRRRMKGESANIRRYVPSDSV